MENHPSQPSIESLKPPKRLRVEPPDLDTLIEDSQQDAAVREVMLFCKVLKFRHQCKMSLTYSKTVRPNTLICLSTPISF